MLNDHLKSRNGWGMGHMTNGTNDSSHVQRLSNGSEYGARNMQKWRPKCQRARKVESGYAQRLSNDSEWLSRIYGM